MFRVLSYAPALCRYGPCIGTAQKKRLGLLFEAKPSSVLFLPRGRQRTACFIVPPTELHRQTMINSFYVLFYATPDFYQCPVFGINQSSHHPIVRLSPSIVRERSWGTNMVSTPKDGTFFSVWPFAMALFAFDGYQIYELFCMRLLGVLIPPIWKLP